jgi:hypothetical protein
MSLGQLHRAVDQAAMWIEDRVARPPAPFRAAPASPLGCFGPLPPLPAGPARPGRWETPSPWPGAETPLQAIVTWPDGPARGAAVLVPPWKIRRPGLMAGWAGALRAAGYEVWLVVPPFHLERAGGRRSGEGFVSADLGRLRDSVGQLVLELRLLSALATGRGGRPALVGLSLGALGAALAATAPEAPPDLALLAPPLDLGAVLSRTRLGRRYRRLAAAAGAPFPGPATLAAQLRPFDPGARPAVSQRLFVAVGRHDAVATRRGALPVVRGWGVTPRTYDRGHLTLLFACRRLRSDLLDFLGAPAARS